MVELPAPLAPLAAYRQFILYELVPDASRPGKTHKYPLDMQGKKHDAHDPQHWQSFDAVADAAASRPTLSLTPGFVFTSADPFFLIDIDDCLVDGVWSDRAVELCNMFAGAAIEISQSGRGLHIIGSGTAPTPRKCKGPGFDLYTDRRFVALTGTSIQGDAGTDHTPALAALVGKYLKQEAAPAGAVSGWTTGPVPDWRGPANNGELLARARSMQQAGAIFGDKASFADLYDRNVDVLAKTYPAADSSSSGPYDGSRADMALAQHLAFWTGSDCERTKRLMQDSKLVREKWENREEYLDKTILKACQQQTTWLCDQEGPIPFERETVPTLWPANALPEGLQEAAEAIANHVQAPIELAGFAVLSAVAHVAQRLADAPRVTGGGMPCSLFTLALAGSGERKTECFRLATMPIDQAEKAARLEHRKKMEQIQSQAANSKPSERAAVMADRPADPRTLYADATAESIARDFVNGSAPALTWCTDEGGSMFGGHSMQSETRANACGMLTRLFDGSGIDRSRVTEGTGSGFRYGIRFGLFLSAQPIVVRGALADTFLQGQGILPRFLITAPASIVGTRYLDEAKLSESASNNLHIKAYWSALNRMNELPPPTDPDGQLLLPTANLSKGAQSLWLENYNLIERAMAPGEELAGLIPFGSRAGELMRRLATVFACWRWSHSASIAVLEINEHDMQSAVAIVNYSLSEWQRQLGGAKLTQTECDARELLDFLHRDSERWAIFSRQKIAQSGPSRLRGLTQQREAALKELLERRWLTQRDHTLHLVKNPH